MASYLYRIRGMILFPRYIPTLMSRAQASQNNPTSGQSASKSGSTKSSDSSVLPKSTTSSDHTNPTKTSSDAPPLDHENVDLKNKSTDKQSRTSSSSSSSSHSSSSQQQPSFLNSSAGKFGTIAVLTVAIYAGYKMISGSSGGGKSLKQNEHYKRATADYQAANTPGTDVKK